MTSHFYKSSAFFFNDGDILFCAPNAQSKGDGSQPLQVVFNVHRAIVCRFSDVLRLLFEAQASGRNDPEAVIPLPPLRIPFVEGETAAKEVPTADEFASLLGAFYFPHLLFDKVSGTPDRQVTSALYPLALLAHRFKANYLTHIIMRRVAPLWPATLAGYRALQTPVDACEAFWALRYALQLGQRSMLPTAIYAVVMRTFSGQGREAVAIDRAPEAGPSTRWDLLDESTRRKVVHVRGQLKDYFDKLEDWHCSSGIRSCTRKRVEIRELVKAPVRPQGFDVLAMLQEFAAQAMVAEEICLGCKHPLPKYQRIDQRRDEESTKIWEELQEWFAGGKKPKDPTFAN
ncbi:hypothetical protein PsYK624_130740 [Phanerochaete sordida]|uniref:Uncharacterized protein n=1 Tax=Phanerochaete sordida TaxID=48140 RepID=A0A9P3LK41_9APHY|nr:hypothetical protein PsYK624_130740 [Phanerochaete sordida]